MKEQAWVALLLLALADDGDEAEHRGGSPGEGRPG
jgi:hypothetical protein